MFPDRIDVHSHFLPDFYRDALHATGHGNPDGMPAVPEWSVEAHLEVNAAVGIKKSYLSISSPGSHLVDGDHESARKLARRCNEHAAKVKAQYPDKFGYWASLPLPDIEGSLAELEHAFDHLSADGIVLETNAHGVYLGSELDLLFNELNRRRAIVFLHPTTPCMIHQGKSQKIAPLSQYPAPMFEFLFDTARAVINMFLSGVITQCPNITFIIPHCGGTLAPLLDRVASFANLVPAAGIDPSVNAAFIYDRLKKQFFFDMAGVSWPNQVKMLAPYISTDQLLYGSDYPFTPHKAVVMLAKTMDSGMEEHWPDEEVRRDVYLRNAERLLSLAVSKQ